ncbi:MAG: hypothetical protein GY879_06605 [Planctomycetes bacterium]|nr:hypothetical protein [Planctomycetota bacterium]
MDPRFVDWQNGDLHLLADSPCLNSGATNLLPPGLMDDLDGNARVIGSQVDLVCYESNLTVQPSMVATSMITEVVSKISVFNAQPGEPVHMIYSFAGLGSGPAVPQLGGLQLDILAPVTLFRSVNANASGHAVASFTVPANAPLISVYLQAAMRRGAGGSASVATNTVSQAIYLKP